MVVPAKLSLQMVSYGSYFLDYGSFGHYRTSRRAILVHMSHLLVLHYRNFSLVLGKEQAASTEGTGGDRHGSFRWRTSES